MLECSMDDPTLSHDPLLSTPPASKSYSSQPRLSCERDLPTSYICHVAQRMLAMSEFTCHKIVDLEAG
jgi:hypothetical protein